MKISIVVAAIIVILSGCNSNKSSNETGQVINKDTPAVLPADTSKQGVEKDNSPMTEQDFGGVGELTLGLSHTKILELLGQPGSKSKSEEWGADGLMHQDWVYKDKGIVLNMSNEKGQDKQDVFSITISKPCAYKTKMNVGIGSSFQEIMAAYEKNIDKENTDTKTITVGSVYGGIIFNFGKDAKAEKIFVGAAAE